MIAPRGMAPCDPELVRRLDWRFLLPDARLGPHLSVVHAGSPSSDGGELLRALRGSGAEVRSLQIDPPDEGSRQTVGLAVLQGAEPGLPSLVAAHLEVGGWIYWELGRRAMDPSGRAAQGIRGRLAGMGYDRIAFHWHLPDLRRGRWIVPAGDPSAVAFLLSRGREGAWGGFLRRVGRSRTGPRLIGLLRPEVSVIARRLLADPAAVRGGAVR